MAGYLTPLSDGSYAEVPDGTDPKDVPNIVAQAESQLADHYGQQARDSGSPVTPTKPDGTPGDKVYSSTMVYPNTAFGRMGAWLDQNVPGANWAEKNVAQPVEAATTPTFGPGGVGGAATRISVNRLAGAIDLPGTGLNILKHQIEPERGTEGDIPSLSKTILDQTGGQELGPDASITRQMIEAAATGATPGGRGWPGVVESLKQAGWGISGTTASDIGGKYFGEPGAFIAQMLFGGAVPIKQPGAAVIAHGTADPSAPDTYAASLAARPITPGGNFQGLNNPPPPGTPDYSQYTPGFKTLANESGQRIATSLSGVPYVGAPLAAGEAADRNFIMHGRDAAAASVSGPQGLPPEGVNAGTLGSTLTSGAQQAILKIVADQEARQQTQRNLMSAPGGPPGSAEVPAGGFYQAGADAIAGRSDTTRAAGQSRLDEIANSSPGGPNYGPGGSGYMRPDVPLPSQPSLTWNHISDMVSELNDSLGKSGRPALPHDVADALKDAANQARQDAANAQSPGAGAQFRLNNVVYARAQAALEQLRQMAGQELGSSGVFKDVPTQQAAASYLKSRMQSPDSLNQTLLHPAFPQDARLNAAAQIIATLGEPQGGGTSGGFRPEAFVNQYGDSGKGQRPTLDALLVGGSGNAQPAAATGLLDSLRTIAEHFSTPTSRFGLIKSLGSAELVRKGLEGAGKVVEHLLPWKAASYLGVPQIGRGMSSMLNSDAVTRAMGGQPQVWGPYANRVSTQGAVADQEQRNRLHYGRANAMPGATP